MKKEGQGASSSRLKASSAECAECPTRGNNPLCSDSDVLCEIQASRSFSHYNAGQTVFPQGGRPNGLYIIRSGLVKLESLARDGSAHTLRLMGPGQIFGHRALFSNENYRASAIAVENVSICFIPKETVQSVVSQSPRVSLNLLGQLSRDLRLAEDKWITQIDREAPERVAEALIFLSDNFVNQPWTRREIAEWSGTTPETVIRTLSQFEKAGWIRAEGRTFTILNREKLSEKAHGT